MGGGTVLPELDVLWVSGCPLSILTGKWLEGLLAVLHWETERVGWKAGTWHSWEVKIGSSCFSEMSSSLPHAHPGYTGSAPSTAKRTERQTDTGP